MTVGNHHRPDDVSVPLISVRPAPSESVEESKSTPVPETSVNAEFRMFAVALILVVVTGLWLVLHNQKVGYM